MTTNEHAGCIHFCRAGVGPGVVRCDEPADGAAWGAAPSIEGALTEAEKVAEADGWPNVPGDRILDAAVDGIAWALLEATMDVADREPSAETYRAAMETARRILAARSQRPEAVRLAVARALFAWDTEENPNCPTWDGLSDDQRGVWLSGADAVLAAQRPEGVTVTEWQTAPADHPAIPPVRGYTGGRAHAEKHLGPSRVLVSRQRTTFPDVVTEWAEVES